MLSRCLFSLVIFLSTAIFAAAPNGLQKKQELKDKPKSNHDCNVKIKKSAREKAQREFQKKNFKAAAEILNPMLGCRSDGESEERDELDYWIISDLGLYLYKSNQHQECLDLLQHFIHPRHQFDSSTSTVNDAIFHNFSLCLQGQIKLMGEVQPKLKCNLNTKGVIRDAIGLPKTMLNKDVEDACVGIAESERSDSEVSSCRHYVLIKKNVSSKNLQQVILNDPTEEDSLVSDSGICCWPEDLSLMQKDSHYYLYLHGHGRDCNGGTADGENHSLFKIQGNQLKLHQKLELNYH